MRITFFPAVVLSFLLTACSPVETIDLEYNALDNPDFNLVTFGPVEYVPSGIVNVRNFYVNFTVQTDSLSPFQVNSITGYQLYENGQASYKMSKGQHKFYKSGVLIGILFEWQIAPLVGDREGPRSKIYSYTVQ